MKSNFKKDLFNLQLTVACLHLVFLVLIFVLTAQLNYSRSHEVGSVLVNEARNNILLGDIRSAVVAFQRTIGPQFRSVCYIRQGDDEVFSLPQGQCMKDGGLSVGTLEIPITNRSLQNEAPVGIVYLSYHRFQGIAVGLVIWFLALVGSIPILYQQRKRIIERHQQQVAQEREEALRSQALQVAHDIRSPLTALKMATGAIGTSLEPEARDVFEKAILRIDAIANGLLKAQKESGSTFPSSTARSETAQDKELASVDPLAVVDEVVREKRLSLGKESKIRIIIDAQDKQHGNVKADAVGLSRILSNLITNAIEALEADGTITLALRTFPKVVQISVIDTGHGIPEDILPTLAQPGITIGKEHGNGLGLSSAKEQVLSWGGQFNISSKVGVGTMVTLTLPRK